MRRSWVILLALVLLAAACGSDDGDAADDVSTTAGAPTTTAAPADTTPAPSTTGATATTTTTAAAATTTTAATSTTTTTIPAAAGTLALTRVVFEPGAYLLITNVGGTDADLAGLWLCRRPSYKQLPAMTLTPGDTIAVGLGSSPPPELAGLAGTIDLGLALGPITGADGEIGLYSGPTFDSADAILDYVQWGSAGHGREAVAVEAGIWEAGTFVEVPEEALSISSSGIQGVGVEAWFADVGG